MDHVHKQGNAYTRRHSFMLRPRPRNMAMDHVHKQGNAYTRRHYFMLRPRPRNTPLSLSLNMADKATSIDPTSPSIDPATGFCSVTNTFHSLRPTIPIPPSTLPLSSAAYILSHLSSSPLPSFPALIDSASRHALSYHDFIACIHSLTSSLQPLVSAVSPPQQVALILSPPTIHIPILYFSLLSLGVVVSPSNPASTPSEIASQIRISRPTMAFTTSAYAHKLPSSLPAILLDSPRFISMLSNGAGGGEIPSIQVSQSDNALILYSSGTTGGVKGVAITHRNVIVCFASRKAMRNKMTGPPPGSRAVALLPLPLFHAFGFFYCLIEVGAGETTVVVMERFEVGKMVKAVEELGITCMMAAPPIVVWMAGLGNGVIDPERLMRSLKLIVCSGAPLSGEVIRKFRKRFPSVQLAQGYGMTESSTAISRMEEEEELQRYGSVGRLSPYYEAKIVDPHTRLSLPPGSRGELCIRGPTVTKGYVGDEAATAAAFDSEGWLKTGDLCYFDDDGFLFVVDRLKELIKYKGYQVPPAELEHLLQSHPEIAEVAVIPFPDEEAGQVPMAFVVRKPGSSLNHSQVMDFVAKQVAPYKKIRRVSFVGSMPRNPAGKILRKDLIKIATSTFKL